MERQHIKCIGCIHSCAWIKITVLNGHIREKEREKSITYCCILRSRERKAKKIKYK